MRIIEPYARVMKSERLKEDLSLIEYAGRISHRSEEDMNENTWEKFIRNVVINHGDYSIIEHVGVPVEMVVDRGISHELVRHRLGSYTQESTRFVNYAKKMPPSFIYPIVGVKCTICLFGDEPRADKEDEKSWSHFDHETSEFNEFCSYDFDWLNSINVAEVEYMALLKKGWRPQEARSVFPNALATKIVVTYNLRMWRHFFVMRTTKEAHPQMRQVTIPLLAEFKSLVPLLFDDIIPESRQIDNLRLPE